MDRSELTVAGQLIWMVTTVIGAITPELVANTATIHAAPIAFLTNSIGCGEKKTLIRVRWSEEPFVHILNIA